MMRGTFPSITATAELVVPKRRPMSASLRNQHRARVKKLTQVNTNHLALYLLFASS